MPAFPNDTSTDTAGTAPPSHAGDPEASPVDERDSTLLRYRPFAQRIAKGYAGRGVHRSDLEQASYLGLIDAYDRFDASRGLKFVTYARYRILGAVDEEVRNLSRPARIPKGGWARSRIAGAAFPLDECDIASDYLAPLDELIAREECGILARGPGAVKRKGSCDERPR